MRRALRAWSDAVVEGVERRGAAAQQLQVWSTRFEVARIAQVLHTWLWLARRRSQLQQAEAALSRSVQRSRLELVLRGWAARAARTRRTEQGKVAMAAAGARWAARMALERWRLVVEAMQGLRTQELRERVVGGACLRWVATL